MSQITLCRPLLRSATVRPNDAGAGHHQGAFAGEPNGLDPFSSEALADRLRCDQTKGLYMRGFTSPGRQTTGGVRRRLAGLLIMGAVLGTALAGGGGTAVAASRRLGCGRPPGGIWITDLQRVSTSSACTTFHKFEAWHAHFYRCAGASTHPFRLGYPVLTIHSFDGWHLSIRHKFYFTMSRGVSSFEIVGFSDAPIGCD